MPGVDTRVPLYVGVGQGYQETIINTGNQSVYYQAASKGNTISSTVNDGAIAPASTLIVGYSLYLLGAVAGAQVDLFTASGASSLTTGQKQLIQLAIIAELLAEGLGVKNASLDYPQNTAAL